MKTKDYIARSVARRAVLKASGSYQAMRGTADEAEGAYKLLQAALDYGRVVLQAEMVEIKKSKS